MKNFRNIVISSLFALTGATAAAHAQDDEFDIDIPAQDLSKSLAILSQQTDAPILADGALVSNLKAPAVSGRMTPSEALEKLLSPSGLYYEQKREKVFRVVSALSVTDRREEAAPEVTPGDEPDVIIVTGTNIRTATNIRGAPTDSAPVLVYDRRSIEESGYGSPEEFLQVQPASFGPPSFGSIYETAPVFDENNNFIGTELFFQETEADRNAFTIHGLSPLQLVNGRRQGGGLENLPSNAIDRIEVLADGASAIYGSGAIAGVANVIMRSGFDGFETRARYGAVADSGAEEYLASAILGKTWGSGSATLAYEYLKRTDILYADRGYVPSNRCFNVLVQQCDLVITPIVRPERVSLIPGEEFHKIYGAAEQQLAPGLSFFAEAAAGIKNTVTTMAIVTDRDTYDIYPPSETEENDRETNYSATVGLRSALWKDWLAEVSATRAAQKGNGANVLTVTAKADGSVMELPGGAAKLALGGEFRNDDSRFFNRDVVSGFGEAFIPLVSADNQMPGVKRLELSLAGRVDHHKDAVAEEDAALFFGDEFDELESAATVLSPRFSALWSPMDGVIFRGSYGRSFGSPSFPRGSAFVYARNLTTGPQECVYELLNCVQTIQTPTIIFNSGEADSTPARSDHWTIGADYSPPALPGLNTSLSFYNVDYYGQLTQRPAVFLPDLANVFPETHSLELTQDFIDRMMPAIEGDASNIGYPFDDCIRSQFLNNSSPVPEYGLFGQCIRLSDAIANGGFAAIDLSLKATGRTRTKGLDASARYEFDTKHGAASLFADANYVLSFHRQLSDETPVIDRLNTFGEPLKFRLRGGAALRSRWGSAAAIVNHASSYDYTLITDPLSSTQYPSSGLPSFYDGEVVKVPAMTTLDLHVSFDLGAATGADLADGLSFGISAINVTNELPPAVPGALQGFDDHNADPTGRFLAFQIRKSW